MKVCIVGAGAMGSLYGALLARSGLEVVFYDTWQEHIDILQKQGLSLTGITGDFTIPVEAYSDVAEVPECDVCLIQTSTYQTEAAAQVAQSVLKDDGFA